MPVCPPDAEREKVQLLGTDAADAPRAIARIESEYFMVYNLQK
jgi:hypothetical protein